MPVYDIPSRVTPSENLNRTLRTEDTAVPKEAMPLLRADLAQHKRGMRHVQAEKHAHRLPALGLLNNVGNLIVEDIQRRDHGERSA
jgi:hypothetical protein